MVWRALKQVFADWKYALLAALSTSAAFVLTTWLPNLGLVWQIATLSTIPVHDKAVILAALVGSIATNFTNFTALIAIVIAVLFGTNVAMTAYALRRQGLTGHRRQTTASATTMGGFASGFFGIGCAACGSIVVTPLLSFLGASSIIAMLPFGGEEFSLVGVGLLGLSIALIARKIAMPAVCVVTTRDGGAEISAWTGMSPPPVCTEGRSDCRWTKVNG